MATKTEEVKIKFTAQTDTQSFKQLERELTNIQVTWARMSNKNPMIGSFEQAAKEASKLESAMAAAYNPKLNTYNLDILNTKLKQSGTSVNQVVEAFNKIGYSGESAVLTTINGLTSMNLQLEKTETILDKIGTSLLKTAGWFVASSAVHALAGSVSEAYGYVKALDTSLNDIRIVTYKSAEEMDKFAEKANKAAFALGKGTKDYTEASLIYYQQGLSDEETAARTDVTIKAANVTQQSTAEVSEQLTAVWNGYKVSANEAEHYVDKLAAVAATTAADLEELSTGMSKVASAANTVGVNVDQMNAMLATTISVTKQSPETVGVAYKTILARMTQLEAGETDEEGVTLGNYTEKMKGMGINVLDEQTGKLRDMGEVIEEVGTKWQNFSREQKIALAQTMAGTRQYNNLVALFDNWDMYIDALQTSEDALGTLNKQQDIYMESTAAHLQQMRTATEGVYDSLLDTKTINDFLDALTEALKVTEKIVDGFGGLKGIIATLVPLFMQIFNKQIATNMTNMIMNFSNQASNKAQISERFANIDRLKQEFAANNVQLPASAQDVLNKREHLSEMAPFLNTSQIAEASQILDRYAGELQKSLTAEENITRVTESWNKSAQKNVIVIDRQKIASESYAAELNQLEKAMTQYIDDYEKLSNVEYNKDVRRAANRLDIKASDKARGKQGAFVRTFVEQNISKQGNYTSQDMNEVATAAEKALNEYYQEFYKQLESSNGGFLNNPRSQKIKDAMVDQLADAFVPSHITGGDRQSIKETVKTGLGNILPKIQEDINTIYKEYRNNNIASMPNLFEEILMGDGKDSYSQDFIKKIENFNQRFKNIQNNQNIVQQAKDFENLKLEVQQYVKSLPEGSAQAEGLRRISEELKLNASDAANAKNRADEYQQSLKKFDISATISAVSSLASSAGMLATSSANLGKNLASGNIPAALTSLGMAAGSATSAISALGKTFSLTAAQCGPWVVAIMAVITVLSIVQQNLEKTAEVAKEFAEKQKAISDEAVQSAESAKEIEKQYEDLNKQYEKGTTSLEELRTATAELLQSYGEEEAAVQALHASYEDLNNIIAQNREEKLKNAEVELQKTLNAQQSSTYAATQAQVVKNGGQQALNAIVNNAFGPFGRIDNVAQMWASGTTDLGKEMSSRLEQAGLKRNIFGHFDLDKLSQEELKEHYNDLVKIQEDFYEKVQQTDDLTIKAFYNDIVQNIGRLDDSVVQAIKAENETRDQLLDNRAQQILGTIDYSKDFEEERKRLVTQFKNIYGDSKTEEEIEKIIHSYFLKIEKTQDKEMKRTLEKNLGTGGKTLIPSLNDEELNFVMNHQDLIKNMLSDDGSNLKEIKEFIDSYLPKYASEMDNVKSILMSGDVSANSILSIDKSLKDKFEKETSNSFSKAYKQGTDAAQQYLIEFYDWLNKQVKEQELIDVDKIDKELEELKRKAPRYTNQDNPTSLLYTQATFMTFFDDTINPEEEVNNLLGKYKNYEEFLSAYNTGTLTMGAYEFEQGDLTTQDLDSIKKFYEEITNYNEQITSLTNERIDAEKRNNELLNDQKNSLIKQVELRNEYLKQELSPNDKDAKKAHKALTAAEKEFEKNGYVSEATQRELLSFGEEYYKYWHDSNGEIKFHSDEIKNIEQDHADMLANIAQENYITAEQNYNLAYAAMINRQITDEQQAQLDKLKQQRDVAKGLATDTKNIADAVKKENEEEIEEVAEAGYYQQKEYEAPKRSTQYIDDEIKQIEDEISYLEKEAEYLTGDSLTKNLEQQKQLREEIVALKEEEVKYNDETINQAKKEYEALAAQYGIKVKYDESGRVSRETMEAMDAATEAAKKSALDAENAAGMAKEANTDKDSKKTFDNQYKQAQENLEKASKLADKNKELSSTINSTINENNKIEREIPEEKRAAALADVSQGYVGVTDKVRELNQQYKLQDAQLQKIKEDFDSLSPDEQLKALQEMKVLKDQQKEEIKQEIQTYAEALQEGLKNVDLGTLDISDITSKSSAELEVMKEQLEDLANKAHERGDIVSEQAIRAAIDQMDGLTDAAKKQEEQNKKTAVSWKELHEAQNEGEFEGVNNALSQTEKQLKRIKSAQSGLKGKDLINNLKQQQALLQKQVALEKQKLAIAAQQTKATATELQGMLAQFNIGVQIKFNQDGSLANYYEIIQAILTCNELDEEGRKILKDITAELQKQAEMRAKTSQEIEDTQQEITNISKTIADKIKEETKNALKKALERFNAKVDVEINIEDAWRQLHKLKAELDGLRDDDYFKNINVQAKQFSEYLKTNPNSLLPGGSTQILTDHLNQIMSEINIIQSGGTSSIYGNGAEAEKQAFEDLKKYRDELAGNVESGLSAIKEMKQTYLSTIDAFISKNQEFMQTLEKINDISQKVIDTMKLVYGDAAIKYIDKYLKAQTQGNQKLLEVAKQKAALAENKMKDALARGDQDAYQKWASAYKTYSDEVWKYIQETIKSAQAEFENLFEVLKQEAIQAYKDVYAETSALPLDMRWDLEGERDKEFKDYTDSLYEVGTLTRKVNESINNADTIAAREKLSKFLQEDIGYLNTQIDKEKQLSKYEIERANAKYELTLRQIALEEAQNNKSKMRLRRDSQGNYRYEYVADQDKINDAAQKVEDAMNKLYNLDKEYARKYAQMISTLRTEHLEKVQEIYSRHWDSEVEMNEAIKALDEEYYGEHGLVTQIYQQGVYARDNLLQTSADKESALIKNVEDTLKTSYEQMRAEVDAALKQIDAKWQESQGVIADAQGTVEGLNQTWEEHSEILAGISEQENTLVENLDAQLAAIEALLPEIEAMAEAWKQVAEQALAANEASLLLRETLKEEEEEAKKAEENAANNAGTGTGANTSSSSGKPVKHEYDWYAVEVNGKTHYVREAVKDKRNGGIVTVDSSGKAVGRQQREEFSNEAVQARAGAQSQDGRYTVTAMTKEDYEKLKKKGSFATGGYTGDWGSEGRLAMLHEKELVLNQNDTKNILNAVQMMRNSMMNGQAMQLGMYRTQYQQALSAISAQSAPLEQNVHIDATFPNVQNSNEIEEAFNNLINLASQRINSNLK